MIFFEYFRAWKDYRNSSGRARRREFLVFCGVNLAILLFCILYLNRVTEINFAAFFAIAAAMPTLTVTIRRLHDAGHSSKDLLDDFISRRGIGGDWLFTCLFNDSERGENDYGPSPKYGKPTGTD